MKPALQCSSFEESLFVLQSKQEGFLKAVCFSQSNVAYRLEIASSVELHNEKSISLMVDKL